MGRAADRRARQQGGQSSCRSVRQQSQQSQQNPRPVTGVRKLFAAALQMARTPNSQRAREIDILMLGKEVEQAPIHEKETRKRREKMSGSRTYDDAVRDIRTLVEKVFKTQAAAGYPDLKTFSRSTRLGRSVRGWVLMTKTHYVAGSALYETDGYDYEESYVLLTTGRFVHLGGQTGMRPVGKDLLPSWERGRADINDIYAVRRKMWELAGER